MSRSTERIVYFRIYLSILFLQFDTFVREHVRHKPLLLKYSMRLELQTQMSSSFIE